MLSLHFKKKLKFFAFGSDPPMQKKLMKVSLEVKVKDNLELLFFLGLFKKFVIKTQGGLIQFFKKLFIGFSFIHSFIF